jgi:hypothetical protein
VRFARGPGQESTKLNGTETGAKAAATVEAFGQRMHAAMRQQREDSLGTAHRLSQNFGTLASGVLIGLTEGLSKTGSAKSAPRRKRSTPTKRRARKTANSGAVSKKRTTR